MTRPIHRPRTGPPRTQRLTLAMLGAALAGCAAVSDPAPRDPNDRDPGVLATALAGQADALRPWPSTEAPDDAARQRIATLLARPLDRAAAQELALLNHRGLQADLAELGVTRADWMQAGAWPNPVFSLQRSQGADGVAWERGLDLALGRLLLRPLVVELERDRLVQQQARVATGVVEHLAQVSRSWVDAVAAEEQLAALRRAHAAAATGAALAERLVRSGNSHRLALAREQLIEAQAALAVAHGEQQRDATRERLTRALGLWGDATAFTLPERLPDLPDAPLDQPDIERRALEGRLDVQAARLATERSARTLGLTRATRWVNVLELGHTRTHEADGGRSRAWELSLELPLFDSGDARLARAEALYSARLHRTAELAVNARSEAREAYASYRHTWEMARYLQRAVLPLQRRISEETLLRYNGMLASVFDLLADARTQAATVSAAIDARSAFWRADADLQAALLGRPALGSLPAPDTPATATRGDGH